MSWCKECRGTGCIASHIMENGWQSCPACDGDGIILPPRDDRGRFRKLTPEEWLRDALLGAKVNHESTKEPSE